MESSLEHDTFELSIRLMSKDAEQVVGHTPVEIGSASIDVVVFDLQTTFGGLSLDEVIMRVSIDKEKSQNKRFREEKKGAKEN